MLSVDSVRYCNSLSLFGHPLSSWSGDVKCKLSSMTKYMADAHIHKVHAPHPLTNFNFNTKNPPLKKSTTTPSPVPVAKCPQSQQRQPHSQTTSHNSTKLPPQPLQHHDISHPPIAPTLKHSNLMSSTPYFDTPSPSLKQSEKSLLCLLLAWSPSILRLVVPWKVWKQVLHLIVWAAALALSWDFASLGPESPLRSRFCWAFAPLPIFAGKMWCVLAVKFGVLVRKPDFYVYWRDLKPSKCERLK